MRLLGAKEFLKTVKPGTLYKRFWLNTEKGCFDLINSINDKNSILYTKEEHEIFGDNSFSLGFIKAEDENQRDYIKIKNKIYDCLFWYDANVVGDASPKTTLYLVYDSIGEFPEKIKIENSDEYLNKEELCRIRKWFLNKCRPFRNELYGWALKELENDEYFNTEIINYKKQLERS